MYTLKLIHFLFSVLDPNKKNKNHFHDPSRIRSKPPPPLHISYAAQVRLIIIIVDRDVMIENVIENEIENVSIASVTVIAIASIVIVIDCMYANEIWCNTI